MLRKNRDYRTAFHNQTIPIANIRSTVTARQHGAKQMSEALSDVRVPNQPGQQPGQESVESVALAGAAAIQRIIAERDNLRSRLGSQQREMMTLTALNEELRRQLVLIRHHYVELGSKILAQLEQFDQVTREVMRDHSQNSTGGSNDDANVVALAHRLKPSNGYAKSAS